MSETAYVVFFKKKWSKPQVRGYATLGHARNALSNMFWGEQGAYGAIYELNTATLTPVEERGSLGPDIDQDKLF